MAWFSRTRPSPIGLARCEAGVAAIEFALFAPMIIIGTLMMVDVGRAVGARMEMDRNVRAGAQAAMSLNNDLSSIRGIILASTENPNDLTVDVGMQCACAGVSALCTAQCTSGAAPAVFVEISALQPYDGIIFPERTLTSLTRVQIR